MNPLVNIFPFFSTLLSTFSWGASDVVSAKVYRVIGSLRGVLFSQVIGIVLLLLLLPLENHRGSINFLPIFILGMADASVWWLFSYAARVGNIAVVGPIFQGSFVTTVILGVVFLGESLTTNKIIGVLLVLMGAVLLSFKVKEFLQGVSTGTIYKGVFPAFIGSIGAGVYLFFMAVLVRENGWVNTTLIVRCGIALSTIILVLSQKALKDFKWSSVPWKIVILMSLFDQLGILGYNIAIKTLDVSLVSVVTSASIMVTVFLAAIFLKDKLTKIQLAGAVTVVLGLVALSV